MAQSLPQLFQWLTPDDWSRVRRAAEALERDDVESVALSVGYIDVGKSPGGQPFVGGMSMDANGGGGLSYRKVPVMLWPKFMLGSGSKVPPSWGRSGTYAVAVGRDGGRYFSPVQTGLSRDAAMAAAKSRSVREASAGEAVRVYFVDQSYQAQVAEFYGGALQ